MQTVAIAVFSGDGIGPEVVGGARPDYTIDSVSEIPVLPLFAIGSAK